MFGPVRGGRALAALALVFSAVLVPARAAEGVRELEAQLARLEERMEAMRAAYEERIARLERRIAELEKKGRDAGTRAAAPADEIARLRAAARAAAGGAQAAAQAPPPAVAVGHERNLNRLNPEISLTGDVVAAASGPGQRFDAREFELDLQSALDPFSSTKLTLAIGGGEVDIEEGYVRYTGLAPGLTLRAGKMRQTFGALNRHHLHALPQVDYPLVYETFFGPEGLAQTGVSVDWLLPHGWSTASEITLQVTDGSSELFSGGSFERLSGLAHVRSYWDLSPATYLEWGLSAVTGTRAPGLGATVLGSDVTLHWQPPARAKYREFIWRTEIARSAREAAGGPVARAWGGYSYLEGLVRRNLYTGLRYDRVFDPEVPSLGTWAIEPYLSWWQSEFVRLRLAYQLRHDPLTGDDDHRIRFQLTWAAGPHKHESY
ncbi:MAG: hypothetical protein D6718_13660 [Acidobacteria bacterium]|nr:MAG: hypothetical protein D6718_13660 [Acidobacteriota bacterium]